MDDRGLTKRAKLGDVNAYDRLVRANQSIAFHVAYAITRNVGEAEDATQESFVKAYYALERFDPDSAFRPWLLRIVTNEALNRVRAIQRRVNLAARLAEDGERGNNTDLSGPEAAAIARERREFVLRSLGNLNDADRVILIYRYLLDLSVAEIADVLAVPQRTVRSRLSRAMERLRNHVVCEANQLADSSHSGDRQ